MALDPYARQTAYSDWFPVRITAASGDGYTFVECRNLPDGDNDDLDGGRTATSDTLAYPLVEGQTFAADEIALARVAPGATPEWELVKLGAGCDNCVPDLCAYYDAAGNVTGYGYTNGGIPRAIVACPALPPPPPPVASGTCPPVDKVCLDVVGASSATTGAGPGFATWDTSGDPSDSRGTYIRYTPTSSPCVFGENSSTANGASWTESNYVAVYDAVGITGGSPGPSDYGTYLPFGWDTALNGSGFDAEPFWANRVAVVYQPSLRRWEIAVGKAGNAGTINPPFASTAHAEGDPPLPAYFPAQTITDDLGGGDTITYSIESAVITEGPCQGVLAPSMGAGLFPGTTPPATFNLATTNPADTASLPMSPVAGGWTGSTSGGSLPVVFTGSGGAPTISIDGVPIPLATGGSTPDVYTFTDGTLTAVVYR